MPSKTSQKLYTVGVYGLYMDCMWLYMDPVWLYIYELRIASSSRSPPPGHPVAVRTVYGSVCACIDCILCMSAESLIIPDNTRAQRPPKKNKTQRRRHKFTSPRSPATPTCIPPRLTNWPLETEEGQDLMPGKLGFLLFPTLRCRFEGKESKRTRRN